MCVRMCIQMYVPCLRTRMQHKLLYTVLLTQSLSMPCSAQSPSRMQRCQIKHTSTAFMYSGLYLQRVEVVCYGVCVCFHVFVLAVVSIVSRAVASTVVRKRVSESFWPLWIGAEPFLPISISPETCRPVFIQHSMCPANLSALLWLNPSGWFLFVSMPVYKGVRGCCLFSAQDARSIVSRV